MIPVSLERNSEVNLYIQLYRTLKRAILSGELTAASKLPTIRQLSTRLNVDPSTVVKAYELLANEELVYKRVGSGTYVRPVSTTIEDFPAFNWEYSDKKIINFAAANPSQVPFPVEQFKQLINHVLDRDQSEAFSYQNSQGFYPLRETITTYLAGQGITAHPDRIQVVSGAQQGLDLIAKVFLDFQDAVVVEEPTYSGALNAFRSRAAHICAVPLTVKGMDLDQLRLLLRRSQPKFVYLMANFHNPTGISWSEQHKQELLRLADEHDFYIVEDDCLSELFYSRHQPTSLKSLDTNDRVIYVKSFSKVFMPGLRLAFILLPPELVSKILHAKHATDISSFSLAQRVFDLYLRNGHWEQQRDQIRALFADRFKHLQGCISCLPQPIRPVASPTGGLYYWLKLPRYMDGLQLQKRALEHGVALTPGQGFGLKDKMRNYFRLSIAATEREEISAGMKILASVCQELLKQ